MLSTEKVTRFYGCKLTTTISAKQHKLRKLIAELSDKHGRSKDFISLYIPKNAKIEETVTRLKNDTETITSKSKSEKDLLQETAKDLIKQLKKQKDNLENGLAIFAGTFEANDSKRLIIEELVPPHQSQVTFA